MQEGSERMKQDRGNLRNVINLEFSIQKQIEQLKQCESLPKLFEQKKNIQVQLELLHEQIKVH